MKITLIGLGAVLGVAKQWTADMSEMFDDVLKLLLQTHNNSQSEEAA